MAVRKGVRWQDPACCAERCASGDDCGGQEWTDCGSPCAPVCGQGGGMICASVRPPSMSSSSARVPIQFTMYGGVPTRSALYMYTHGYRKRTTAALP